MDILSDKKMLVNVINTLKKQQSKKKVIESENNLKHLFDDNESELREKVYLTVALIKLPPIPENGKAQPMSIKSPIPHTLVDKFTNVLLITRDLKGHGKDYIPSVNEVKNKLRNHDALGLVSEIMTVRQIRTEYHDFESRRNLASQFDIVLCDKEVVSEISHHLGKPFYRMKKKPLQVNLETKDLKKSLEECLSRSILHLSLEGSCSTTQIGRINQTSEEIADNILSTISHWKKLMPGGWMNIRSINLKTETSKSLPLFVSTTLPKDIPEVAHPYALKDDVIAVEEISTKCLDNGDEAVVQVTQFGDVNFLSKKEKSDQFLQMKVKKKSSALGTYDPETNKISKKGIIVNKKNKGWMATRRWSQPKKERYFKNEMNLSTSSNKNFKGLNAKRGNVARKRTNKKISNGGRKLKSGMGAKSPNLKRKRNNQQSTNSRNIKKRKVPKE